MHRNARREAFTLIEMLIYTAIFAVTSVFLLSILTTVTRTQLRQSSVNEVNQQLSFVASTIQRLVRTASFIADDTGIATTTLTLRMSASAADTTKIYADSNGTALYIEEIPSGSQSGTPIALTSDKVKVTNFSVTKYEEPGGLASVQVNLTLDYNTTNPQATVSKTWQSAIARISAATFDSSLLPNADATTDLGAAITRWRNLYLSGDASVAGSLGLGTTPPSSGTKLKSTGNIAIATSTAYLILMSPNGTCYRVGVSNGGGFTTSSVGCP
jgi:type II secretory pathway pseudopilin PulG